MIKSAILSILLVLSGSFISGNDPEELQEKQVRKAYMKKNGIEEKIGDENICVEIPDTFPHVAAVGSFAHDKGCSARSYYFNGEFMNLERTTQRALQYYGWSDEEKRSDLARHWTKKIVYAWSSPLTSEPKRGFEKGEFFKPTVTIEKHGVVVDLWVQEPAGMLPEDNYFHARVTYGPKGEVSTIEKVAKKKVPYR